MKIVITGIGLLSCLGSLETTWRRLIAGQSGIQQHQPFEELESRFLGLIGDRPFDLLNLTKIVVAYAIEDAALSPPLPDCGVVIGSSRSQQGCWEKLARGMYAAENFHQLNRVLTSPPTPLLQGEGSKEGSKSNSPTFPCREGGLGGLGLENWLETMPNMGAIGSARQIGTIGPVLVPMAACATGIWAIAQGFELIKSGQCDRVIAGAVEAPITPLTLAGFQQMGALAKTGAYPFDRDREGLVLAEGGAVFVIETEESARRREAKVYAEILGFGLTSDAYHAISPDPAGWSAILAVKQCLDRSHLSSIDIDYIHAHGTATQLNDKNEAQVIQHLFPQRVAVSSTKGATGHTLGASGALGAAFCLMALKHQIIPPNVGLRKSEFDLDLVKLACRGEIRNVLCFSFGFGGQNAVMALAKL